jgi:glutamine synthetase
MTAFQSLRVAAADLNGIARGKRLPAAEAPKADAALRMPYSALNVDIWGYDIEGSPLVFASGDGDAWLRPTGRGPLPLPWLPGAALQPMWMFGEDGTPFAGDPRHALSRVLDRFAARGLTPVVALEIEFYLSAADGPRVTPPADPASGRPVAHGEVLDLERLDAFAGFFDALYAACDAMGIPAGAAISEGGPAQFEIALRHAPDALRAADDLWLFKQAVRGVARAHGHLASFMAKPIAGEPGCGMHAHVSLLNRDGQNVFDDGSETGARSLRHAAAGCLAAMRDCTLIFAPHRNSYRRLTPYSHAPRHVVWGYENRTAAIRIPGGAPAARRLEHRVAGADANPYLVLAAVLGGMLAGIEDAADPPPAVDDNAYETDAPTLIGDWGAAIEAFAQSPATARLFAPELVRNLLLCKRQEHARFEAEMSDFEFDSYRDRV